MNDTSDFPSELATNEFYWLGIEQGELLFQQCVECGRPRHPPNLVCETCRSCRVETRRSEGRGVIYSYTIFERPRIPGLDMPVTVVLVALQEGVRVLGGWAGDAPPVVGIRVKALFASPDLGPARLMFEVE